MGSGSAIIFDLSFNESDASKNRRISDLMSYLKSAFLPRHYEEVERILVAREANLKYENKTLIENYELLRLEKLEAEDLLGKSKKECWELKELIFQINEKKQSMEEKYEKLVEKVKNGEKNEKKVNVELESKISQLESEKRKAEAEVEVYRGKFEELVSRVLQLEGDILAVVNENLLVSKEVGGEENLEKERMEVNVIDCDEDNGVLMGVGASCHTPIKGNGGLQAGGSRLASGGIVEIIDSDDDCSSAGDLSGNKMTSQKLTDNAHSGQKGVECGTRELKRKRDSFVGLIGSENYHKEDDNIDTNTQSGKCKMMKQPQELIHKPNNSPVNHCSPALLSSVVLRQCVEKMEVCLNSQNCLSKLYAYDNEDSSSSSDSEDDTDGEFSSGRFKVRDSRTWKLEVDLLCAFEQDPELCMKAVCALYRQQDTAKGGLTFSSNRGFNQFDAHRGTILAEFLIDGDPQANLKKSVKDLDEFDPNGLSDCKRIAKQHSKILFEIYQKKQDPLFPAC